MFIQEFFFFDTLKILQYNFSKTAVCRNSWPGQASWPSCEPESEMDYEKKSWPTLNLKIGGVC